MSNQRLSEQAFGERAERHRRELHVHCYRMLGSFEAADDAVQETLLRAWRSRGSLERDEWFRAWLYKIATNACLDAIKRDERRVPSLGSMRDVPWLQPDPDPLLEEVAPSDEQPDTALVQRETIELAFLAVIQLLPPRQRAVLILRDVLDWPAADVAEQLDMPVAAVNSALQRAKATLRAHLPTGRREEWRSPEASERERVLLEAFIQAHETADVDLALSMCTDDIRVTMPPLPMLYEGREAIMALVTDGLRSDGEWRLVATRANRMPTAACYLRAPGDDTFRAFKFDVLRIDGDKIAEITTFGATLFEVFGLPLTLEAG
jgi:RNA polymerase sigma-70 factor (ECF subfamily)